MDIGLFVSHPKLLRTARDQRCRRGGEETHWTMTGFLTAEATPCPGTLLQTHTAHHTEAQSVLHARPLELWDWSHPNDLPTGDTSESSRAQGGPHSVPVIQSSPPTYESFPSRMEEAGHICSHLCIYWLPQVNRQGAAWAGPQKYMGPE